MNTEKSPLISVIVPVYKVEKYLPACLDSLLAQTYRNFELILVDDGSPDKCWEILQQYAAQDARVRIFRKENGGVSSARNFGLEQARGEYIGFVDSDDFVAPQYLEWLLDAAQQKNAKIAIGEMRRMPMDCYAEDLPLLAEQSRVQEFRLEEYSYWCRASCLNVVRGLFQRDVVQKQRFDTAITMGEDAMFFMQSLLKVGKLAYIDAPLYVYRIWGESSYQKSFTEKQYSEVEAWEKICAMTQNVPGPLHFSAEEKRLMACGHVYYKMLDAHWPDKALRETVRNKVWQDRRLVWEMKSPPRWKKWSRVKLLSMLYLPAWFNGVFWRRAEQLRAKRRHRTGPL